jgi:hypothetical protein
VGCITFGLSNLFVLKECAMPPDVESNILPAAGSQAGVPSEASSRSAAATSLVIPWSRVAVVIALSVLCAAPAVQILDGMFPVENLSVEMTNLVRNNPNDPVAWAQERFNRWSSLAKTSAACLAVFGAVLAALSALVSGVGQQPVSQRLRALVLGALIGGLSGVVGGLLESTFLIRMEKAGFDRSTLAMAGHAIGWFCLAVGMAVSVALSQGTWSGVIDRCGRGLVAAGLAAVVYAVASGLLFQMVRSDLPIPEGIGNPETFLQGLGNQTTFLLMAAVCLSIAVLRSSGVSSSKAASASGAAASSLMSQGATTGSA